MADDIGFIYLAVNDTMPGLVKIGYTKGNVQERMKELSADTGVPAPFKCAYSCKVQNPAEAEKQLHQNFFYCRESGNREFFRADWRVVQAVIEDDFHTLRRSTKQKKIAKKGKPVGKFTLVKWVKEGDAENVRRVFAIGGKPDQADEYKQTALMWAAQLGHADIANILLDKGANPNKTLNNGRTALMLAVEGGHARIAKSLLDYGAHASVTDKDGETALMKTDKADVIKTLLNSGVPANDNALRILESDKARRVAEQLAEELIAAVRNDNAAEVQRLIAVGASPDTAADNDLTVLIIAARLSYAEVAQVLLDCGANPNAANKDGVTALMSAAERYNREICLMLLDSGADPDAMDSDNKTALDWADKYPLIAKMLAGSGAMASKAAFLKAVSAGDFKTIQMYMDGGMDADATDECGVTALMMAVRNKHVGVVELLLAGGANLEATEKTRSTSALTMAATKGHVKIAKMLLNHGANPDGNGSSWTPLNMAAKKGHAEIVKTLLNGGANPDAGEGNGWTALMYAATAGKIEVVKALLAAGANPNVKRKDGWTALDMARKWDYPPSGRSIIVRMLEEVTTK